MDEIIERLQFLNSAGIMLDAKLNLPETKPIAYVVLAHCFATSKELIAEARIASALTRANMAVLRFDFTGLGKSGGDFSETNFTSNVGDILVLREWDPKKNNYTGRVIEKEITFVLKTKELDFWPEEEIEKHGYVVMGFK